MSASEDRYDVHLLELPVKVWAQAQERTDALLREFALIGAGEQMPTHHVPRRLLALIDKIEAQFSGLSAAQDLQLQDAAASGRVVIDLRYEVPQAVAEASVALEALLDEADAYCATGRHLLTLSPTPEELRFRRWYLRQFVDQIAGKPAVAWPDWP